MTEPTKRKSTQRKAPLREYGYCAYVIGAWDGVVVARNKTEAIKMAKEEIYSEGLVPDGEIEIERHDSR